jgi:fucose 4-O-acetylase-like acetyltransferase
MSRAQEIHERTPAHRDRYVDFLRAVSILFVVAGHWLVIHVFVDEGTVTGLNVLGELRWTHWATWVFQVMPVFFFVGGFANAASWDSHRRKRGGRWVPWVLQRADRLLRPTTLFLGLGVALVVVARAAGVEPAFLDQAAWLVVIALWFLATYLGLTAASPLMLAAHERWGAMVAAALVAGVVVVDVVRLGFGIEWVGLVNFALGWLVFQQLGFLWRDGTLTRSRTLAPAAAIGGLALLIGLTVAGPYPVSMVAVPGEVLDNTAPPTFALVVLGVAQMGVALTLRPLADGLLGRPRPWFAVVSVNTVIMTIYLWHLVPVAVVGLLMPALPWIPQPEVQSAAWLAWRPAWVAALGLLLVPMVLLASGAERAGAEGEPPPERGWGRGAAAALGLGVLLASLGLYLFTTEGLHGDGPLGLPVAALATYLPGVLLIRLVPSLRDTEARASA